MNNSKRNDKDLLDLQMARPVKKLWKVGNIAIIVIDNILLNKLGIDEENTFLQQQLTEDGTGILMKVKKVNSPSATIQSGSPNDKCDDFLSTTTIADSD